MEQLSARMLLTAGILLLIAGVIFAILQVWLYQQQAAAQIEVEKPFPQEEELAEKSARLAELNAQLDVDEKSHDPEQDEEEQEDAPRRPSVLAALEEKSDKPETVKPFKSYLDKDGDTR